MRTTRRGSAMISTAMAVAVSACTGTTPFPDVVTDIADIPDAAMTPIGSACGLDPNGEALGGCSTGQTCLTPRQGFPNGYCAGDCLRTDCPSGSECYALSATQHVCVERCSTDADCRRADGYACIPPRMGAAPACLPNPEPVGRREDGSACFTSTNGDAGATHALAPLEHITFRDPAISASRNRLSTVVESDPSLAVDPTNLHPTLVSFGGYTIQNMVVYWRGGYTQIAADGSLVQSTEVRDADFPDVSLVDVAYDHAGHAHMAFFAQNTDRPGNPIRYTHSEDGGSTFARVEWLFPESSCLLLCESPALAIGFDEFAQEIVIATTIQSVGDATALLYTQQSPAFEFIAPVTLATVENGTTARRTPRASGLATSETPGSVAIAWVDENVDNLLASLGDRENRVRVRLGIGDATPPIDLSRAMDAPVRFAPGVAMVRDVIHVVYVTGGLTGIWDVVLATSRDRGRTWSHRIVNDDGSCATHGWPSIAIDPATGDAHVLLVDNRFGPGEVVYARCPADPAIPCGRNEAVSDVPFPFDTSTDPSRWLGTRTALERAPDGTLWAAWTDTRTGGPGIYVTRGR